MLQIRAQRARGRRIAGWRVGEGDAARMEDGEETNGLTRCERETSRADERLAKLDYGEMLRLLGILGEMSAIGAENDWKKERKTRKVVLLPAAFETSRPVTRLVFLTGTPGHGVGKLTDNVAWH
ncbi:hypothetical protein KM043_006348 [Ampulex compressa]|nr:hypothetical protein KM043_006348 [Ampulex compressa]